MADARAWLEGIGAGAIVAIGAFLFFFPEPFTTVAGVAVLLIGIGMWIVEWWGERSNSSTEQRTRPST